MNTRHFLVALLAMVSATTIAQNIPSISPITGKNDVDKGFGPRLHPLLNTVRAHNGADFDVPLGTKVLATANGTVSSVGEIEGYGICVRIRHANGYQTLYAHLSKYLVSAGQRVSSGLAIAESGNSGASSHPHLHYEVIKDGKSVDPKAFLSIR